MSHAKRTVTVAGDVHHTDRRRFCVFRLPAGALNQSVGCALTVAGVEQCLPALITSTHPLTSSRS